MRNTSYFFLLVLILCSCSKRKEETVIRHGNLVIRFDQQLNSLITSAENDAKPFMKNFSSSEFLEGEGFSAKDFVLSESTSSTYSDSIGSGTQWIIKGEFNSEALRIAKILNVIVYDKFPDQAFYQVSYVNHTSKDLNVSRWVNHHYEILSQGDSIPFWSFQGESTGERRDWVLPLRAGFHQQNFMGMNNSDYGGGVPVTDVWRRDLGIAVGSAETMPVLISLPVTVTKDSLVADISVAKDFLSPYKLASGDTLKTTRTFINVHHGDYYIALKRYGEVLRAEGIHFAAPETEAFEASWCAWGYMRDVTLAEIRGTLPKVKELGIKWVTIDDGYQQAEGDWHVNSKMFPKGDVQMRALVDEIHRQGFKVMLWWAPLAADPGSKLLAEHPDMKITNAAGKPQDITWWDAYYLAPTDDQTKIHTREMLDLFLKQWDVDGLKMDGQHLNAVPEDYGQSHELTSPEQSFEKLPEFFKLIYDEANRIKPHTVIQNCPCGTCMSPFNMPYMNQAVASDPLSSWQVRSKGKSYKAILKDGAYFGDHVELSDGRTDFASSFGVGAVLGSKFTWPKENPTVKEDNLLTPLKEVAWKKWLTLYRTKMLSRENYRGELYDIGYDIPETHVIQKGDTLHYAFYNASWNGMIELRGLTAEKYKVRDYVNGVDLGEVTKQHPQMNFRFEKNLLIELYPVR